jgi:hypothetical protein
VTHRRLIITLAGVALMTMFIGDSAATSYGTTFMTHALHSTGGRVQVGLFAYLVCQLLGRIVADRIIGALGADRGCRRADRGRRVYPGRLGPQWTYAAVGFALMGLGPSVVVPLTFSAADGLDPAGTGVIIARVNLFNYAGVIIGARVIGTVAGFAYAQLRLAFAIPAVVVLLITMLAPAFRVVDAARAAAQAAGER